MTVAGAKERYKKRCVTVQQLHNDGYTRTQIRALYPLIMADLSADEIKAMFPANCNVEEIENLAKEF